MRENTTILRTIATKATVGTQITEAAMIAAANLLSGSNKWNSGNLLPSDHAGVFENGKLSIPPAQSAQRADYIFLKVGRGLYQVVPAAAFTPMPQSNGQRAKSDPAVARAEALKLLGITEESLKPKQDSKPAENKPVSK